MLSYGILSNPTKNQKTLDDDKFFLRWLYPYLDGLHIWASYKVLQEDAHLALEHLAQFANNSAQTTLAY
jgi:hypothetical protein